MEIKGLTVFLEKWWFDREKHFLSYNDTFKNVAEEIKLNRLLLSHNLILRVGEQWTDLPS
jgi:hypothetical protein